MNEQEIMRQIAIALENAKPGERYLKITFKYKKNQDITIIYDIVEQKIIRPN